jgi:hypothetical protein
MNRFAAIVFLAAASAAAHATTFTWTGAANNLWSNAANWSPAGVPQSGDHLVFPYRNGFQAVENDLPSGRAFSLQAAPNAYYEIRGNEIVSRSITTSGGALTIYVPLRLDGDAEYTLNTTQVPIDIGVHRLALDTQTVTGPLSGSGNLHLLKPTTVRGAHSFNGRVTGVAGASLHAQGATLPATIELENLSGVGTVGPVTVSKALGGNLTTGSLKVAPGAGFHASPSWLITVNGTVDITGSVLNLSQGLVSLGQVFKIIDNDGTDAIVGTFKDLPEGAAYDDGHERFIVSYVGGDGNDVTLTAVRVWKYWTGGGGNDNRWSNPANWRDGVLPASGDSVSFQAEGTSVNDIPVLTLHTLQARWGDSFMMSYPTTFIQGEPIAITSRLAMPSMSARVRAAADGAALSGWFHGGIDVGNHDIDVWGRIYAATPDRGVTGTGTIRLNTIFDGYGYASISGVHTFSGTVVAQTMTVDGEMPAAFQLTGSLEGRAAIGGLSLTGIGTLAPKPFFDTRNLSVATDYLVGFQSLDEALDVTGTVTLASPRLELAPRRYVVGKTYVTIRNDGTDAVAGTFAGVPEGSIVRLASLPFDARVSYVGGDGNDLTVTPLAGPALRNDFDRDGKADIVWHHRGGNGNQGLGLVHRMSMDGLAIASQETVYAEPNLAWRPVLQGDFDANGVSDIVWRNTTSGEVYLMLFGPEGRPAGGSSVTTQADPTWRLVAAADLNGDGKPYLVWHKESGEQAGLIYLMYGAGTPQFSGYAAGFIPASYRVAGVGNVYGDASIQLVLRESSGSGRVSIYTMARGGEPDIFRPANPRDLYQEPDSAWQIVAVPDLNGDGKADLLWQHAGTGILYGMLSAFSATSPAYAPVSGYIHFPESPAWVVATTGDYDGDGKDDILWHNEADGRVHVMLMNGLAIKDQRTIYREPDTGWKPIGGLTFNAP